MATVIVEPDSVSAWLGLAGVALGVLLTSGVTWLQGSRRERRERKAKILNAVSELTASANTLQLYTGVLRSRKHDDSALTWTKAIAAQMERVQTASDNVTHLAGEELGTAAFKVAQTAFAVATEGVTTENTKGFSDALGVLQGARYRFLSQG